MVAREDAQMVSGLVAQSVMVVCVEPHEYGGATGKDIRDLGKEFSSHTSANRVNELNSRRVHYINKTLLCKTGIYVTKKCFMSQCILTWIWKFVSFEIQASSLHKPSSCEYCTKLLADRKKITYSTSTLLGD